MSKILLGINVDDKIYEEYASHKYVMATNNRNGEGTPLSTIIYMASSQDYQINAPEIYTEANNIIESVKKELQEFYKISTGKTTVLKYVSFTEFLEKMKNVYLSAMEKYDALADKKEAATETWDEIRKPNAASDEELTLAKASFINATNEFNTEYEKLLNDTHAKANEIRMELMKQTEDFYTINPDRVEPGTMDLLMSGVLNEHDINVLAERNRSNTTMLRMILQTAEELDSGLAYKIKNIGTGENEMNILNDVATWGERCISEDRTVANVNRQHYDRIYAGLCEDMENLYAKPSL